MQEPLQELLSVHSFKELATRKHLEDDATATIAQELTSLNDVFFDEATTFAKQLDAFLALDRLLLKYPDNKAVKTLRKQCRHFIGLILGAPTLDKIPELLAHRALRLPYDPDFISDAPLKCDHAPLDSLVNYQQKMQDKHSRAQDISDMRNTIVRDATEAFRQVSWAFTHREEKTEKIPSNPKLSKERKQISALQIAYAANSLLFKGDSKLTNEADQDLDDKLKTKQWSGKKLEEKRFIPWNGRFYQLRQEGAGDNRCIKMVYFSTENMLAHQIHQGEAIFVVTRSGGYFASTTTMSAESGESEFHSSLDRNPIFAGRISVDIFGYLRYYDNYTGHFLHSERNLLNITRVFRDIGVIGPTNPNNVIACLVMQRGAVVGDEHFRQYLQKFEQFPLWDANEKLMAVRLKHPHLSDDSEALQTLYDEAIAGNIEQLKKMYAEAAKHNNIPEWLTNWEEKLGDPRCTFAALGDHLRSDAVNLNAFLAAKQRSPLRQIPIEEPRNPATDDRAAGIRNDWDSGDSTAASAMEVAVPDKLTQKISLRKESLAKGRADLEILRQKLRLKLRLDSTRFTCVVVEGHPYDEDIERDVIYFYSYLNSVTHTCYRLRINAQFIHTGQIQYDVEYLQQVINDFNNPNLPAEARLDRETELEAIKQATTKLQWHEEYLIATPEILALGVKSKKEIILLVQQHFDLDIAIAFSDEFDKHDTAHHLFDPPLQANNLFYGKMCLSKTNRGGDAQFFDPSQKRKDYYRVFKKPEQPCQTAPVQVIESDEEDSPEQLVLVRQDSFFSLDLK